MTVKPKFLILGFAMIGGVLGWMAWSFLKSHPAIFAIAGLLAVAYLILRQRK